MPAPLSSSSSSCLKHRLLGGASLGVMVLAASFAVTSPAVAQVISSDNGAAPDALVGDAGGTVAITNDADAAEDFGVIDTDGGADNFASITLTDSDVTIFVHDATAGGETSTVGGNLSIEAARTASFIFAGSDTGTASNDATLVINGNLGDGAGGQGGSLAISVRDQVDQDASRFDANGSTNLSAVTVTAGAASNTVGGGDINANFGDATTDTFAATTLEVHGGDGAPATDVANSSGGHADVDISGNATTTGTVLVESGNAGADAADNGGNAHLSFESNTGTVTLGGLLTVRVGADAGGGDSGTPQVSFASMTVNANGGIALDDNASPSANAIAEFNGTGNQTVNGFINGTNAGDGELWVTNTGGMVTFNNTIGDTDAIGLVRIDGGANVLFNDNIGTTSFTLNGVGSTLAFNATDAVQVALGTGGTLTLDQSTINLGSNLGAGDTVFQLDQAGAASNLTVTTPVANEITVNLAANFTTGTLTLIDDDADNSADVAQFTATDTALTVFTVGSADTNNDIVITAAATTNAQAAATLGVTTDQANALRQAVTSTATSGDTTNLDNLTAALNAGGTQATNAARQVGPQGETLEGGAQVAFSATGQQQGITGGRLSGFRSGDPRFVSAFAATENGFSGGDYSAPYSASAPRYSSSVWFQAFGGVADADADTLIAGYDAAFGGAMIGVDGMVTDNITIGAFGSYTLSSVDGDGVGNAQLDANTYTIGVYAGYTGASFYLDGFASYAGSDNDVTRTAFGQTITGEYDASQFAIGAALGVPIEVSSNVFITPNASLTYNHYDADSYTETGSLGFSATVNPGSASQLTGTLGARFHAVYEDIDGSGTDFIPEVRLGVIGDLVDDDSVSTANFVGGGTAFNVTGTDTDDIGALIGLGLALDNDGWAAGISYDGDIRSDYMSHTARAEFRWKF